MPEDRPPRERRTAPLKKNQNITIVGTEFRENDGRIRFQHKGTKDKRSSPKKEREEFLKQNRYSQEEIDRKQRRQTYLRETAERYEAEVGSDDIVKRVYVRDSDAEDRYHDKLNQSGGRSERPPRRDSDRGGRPRSGDRRPRDGERRERRSYGEHSDRPPRREGERRERPAGDRPRRDGERRDRPQGDRPRRDFSRFDDRPRRDSGRPRSGGDRPRRDRNDSDRPRRSGEGGERRPYGNGRPKKRFDRPKRD